MATTFNSIPYLHGTKCVCFNPEAILDLHQLRPTTCTCTLTCCAMPDTMRAIRRMSCTKATSPRVIYIAHDTRWYFGMIWRRYHTNPYLGHRTLCENALLPLLYIANSTIIPTYHFSGSGDCWKELVSFKTTKSTRVACETGHTRWRSSFRLPNSGPLICTWTRSGEAWISSMENKMVKATAWASVYTFEYAWRMFRL